MTFPVDGCRSYVKPEPKKELKQCPLRILLTVRKKPKYKLL